MVQGWTICVGVQTQDAAERLKRLLIVLGNNMVWLVVGSRVIDFAR